MWSNSRAKRPKRSHVVVRSLQRAPSTRASRARTHNLGRAHEPASWSALSHTGFGPRDSRSASVASGNKTVSVSMSHRLSVNAQPRQTEESSPPALGFKARAGSEYLQEGALAPRS
jgi:hypothetical protein